MYKSKQGFLDNDFLKYHQIKSAEIIVNFLKKNNCSENQLSKVYHLIANHEFGGDFESDILKDADSLSFFKINAEHFIKVKTKETSIKKVKEKLEWMYNRISYNETKESTLHYYKKAILKLEKNGSFPKSVANTSS
jgi:hypothetical protein